MHNTFVSLTRRPAMACLYPIYQYIFIIFAGIFSTTGSAYSKHIYTQTITKKDGLPAGHIRSMVQDHNGIVWLGMDSALYQYDGLRFYSYNSNESTPYRTKVKGIYRLKNDKENNLYIASSTGGGLVLYNAKTAQFRNLFDSMKYVADVAHDDNGKLWAGMGGELVHIDKQDNIVETYKHSGWVKRLLNHQGDIYYYHSGKEKYGLHKVSGGVSKHIRALSARFMFSDKNEEAIWVANKEGLWEYRPKQNKWSRYLTQHQVSSAIQYGSRHIWLSTFDFKLVLFNTSSKLVESILDQSELSSSLKSVNTPLDILMVDQHGVIWLYDKTDIIKLYHTNVVSILDSAAPATSNITQIIGDGHEGLWVSAYQHGLMHYDRENGFVHYPHPKYKNLSIKEMYLENSHTLWLGSREGIHKFNSQDQSWRDIDIPIRDQVRSINGIGEGRLIVTTDKMYFIDTRSYKIEPLKVIHDKYKLINGSIFDASVIDLNRLFLTGTFGSGVYNFRDHTFKSFNMPGQSQIEIFRYHNIQDAKKNIWTTKYSQGIEQFLYAGEGKYIRSQLDGVKNMPKNVIKSIIEDKDAQIWLINDEGFFRFDPISQSVLRLDQSDGIPVGFTKIRSKPYSDKNNILYVGLGALVAKVDATKLVFDKFEPKVVMSQIQVNNKPLFNTSSVELDYANNNIAFKFASLDHRTPSRNQYAYRLDPFDKGWVYSGNNSEAYYTNLPHGKYLFKVKATNKFGKWSSHTAEFSFVVSTPVWMTWWAYCFYIIIFMTLFSLVLRVRERRLSKYAAKLEEKVKNRTARINELLENKNEVFSNISHELRTPLTLIQGPITQVYEGTNDSSVKNKLGIALKNTQRLNLMVEQLLKISRANTVGLEDKKPCNIFDSIVYVCGSIKSYADNKNIKIVLENNEAIFVDAVDNALETVILNLCINAIKYSPEGTQVKINWYQENSIAYLSILDEGPGILAENQNKIFDRFTRFNNTEPGAGLGLALVKELVNAHDGEIYLDKHITNGSKFIVELPLSQKSDDEISKQVYKNKHFDLFLIDCINECNTDNNINDFLEGAEHDFSLDDDTKKHILIIDDTVEMCQYIKDLLCKDYICNIAHDGDEGLRIAKEICPDLILCDIMMPKLDGFDVVDRIRHDISTSHIPIIMLSAMGGDDARVKCYEKLADDFITKPFNNKELKIRIKSILELKSITLSHAKRNFGFLKINESSSVCGEDGNEKFMKKFQSIIENNYHKPEFNVNSMGGLLFMSNRSVQRKLKYLISLTPFQYLRIYRIQKAVELLSDSEEPVNEIIKKVGFSNRSRFYSNFKDYTGFTPREYRDGIKVTYHN